MKISDDVVCETDGFEYLKSVVIKNGTSEEGMKNRIKCG